MGALDCVSSGPTVGRIASTESTEVLDTNKSSNSSLDFATRDLECQQDRSRSPRKYSWWWNVGLDLPILLVVLVLLGLFELGVIPSYKSGFFCNDPSLAYPFTGDTVSMAVLVVTVLLLPAVVVLITEFIFEDSGFEKSSRTLQALRTTGYVYRGYLFGFCFNLFVVEVMKGITGRPRPTFFDICQPDTGKTCVGSEYVSTFRCTSTRFSTWFQLDASHSFPSGHTSLSVLCGLFIAWYLQRRAFSWRHRSVLGTPLLQLVAFTYACFCSLTRVTDHRHHWSDVAVGTVIGVLSMLYSVYVLCDNFSYASPKKIGDVAKSNPQPSGRTFV